MTPQTSQQDFDFATNLHTTPLSSIGQVFTISDWFSLEKLYYDWLMLNTCIGGNSLERSDALTWNVN